MQNTSLRVEAVALLRERYGYLRTEILHRLDNRYKLLTALLTIVAVGCTVIFQLHWEPIAFPLCGTMLLVAIVLQGENRHVQLISDYLITIERELDEHYQLETKGWERTSRLKGGDKPKASSRLTIGALAFLALFYIIFTVVGVRWATIALVTGTIAADSSLKHLDWSEWPLISTLALSTMAPLIVVLMLMWLDYRRFWRRSSR